MMLFTRGNRKKSTGTGARSGEYGRLLSVFPPEEHQ
jgi:hypothetical protein